MVKSDLNKFAELVESMTAEYLRERGYITCEFSTDDAQKDEKNNILAQASRQLSGVNAKWVMFPCDTCQGHDSSRSIHVEIKADNTEQASA